MIFNKHYLGARVRRLNLCGYSLNTKGSTDIWVKVSFYEEIKHIDSDTDS